MVDIVSEESASHVGVTEFWPGSSDFLCEFTAPRLQVEVLVLRVDVRFIAAGFVCEFLLRGEFGGFFFDLDLRVKLLQFVVCLAVVHNEFDAEVADALYEELKVGF